MLYLYPGIFIHIIYIFVMLYLTKNTIKTYKEYLINKIFNLIYFISLLLILY